MAEEDAQGEEGRHTGSAVFRVRCFGSFEVRANGQEISRWKVQKARELLAYLIARGGTGVLRDEVAEALWPDGDPGEVQRLLSNAAYYLRRAMKSALAGTDVQVFVTSGQRYHLRTGELRVDVEAFDAHLRRAEALEGLEALAEYERALAFYQGDFLGSEPYEWADAYRREYQRRFLAATHQAARLAGQSRDVEKAMHLYRAILASDPIDEEAARGLMRCYSRLGDVNGARKLYKVLTESLRRELEDENAEPLPETTALFQEFMQKATRASGRTP